jgi:hypothetical protein
MKIPSGGSRVVLCEPKNRRTVRHVKSLFTISRKQLKIERAAINASYKQCGKEDNLNKVFFQTHNNTTEVFSWYSSVSRDKSVYRFVTTTSFVQHFPFFIRQSHMAFDAAKYVFLTVADHFQYSCFLGLLASVTDGSRPCVVS